MAKPSSHLREIGVTLLLILLLLTFHSVQPVSVEASPRRIVRVGESFTITQGDTEIRITCQSLTFAAETTLTYEWTDLTWHYKADQGYRLAILKLVAANVGMREVDAFSLLDTWEMHVDSGYIYKAKYQPSHLNLRPTEEKSEYVVFEILQETNPVWVCYLYFMDFSGDWTFILQLSETPPPLQPDFSLSTSSTSLTTWQDSSQALMINVTSIDGFSSQVHLTISGQPLDAFTSFNPEMVAPPSNGFATSQLEISTGQTPLGTYTLTVTGAGDSKSHAIQIELTVEAVSAPSIEVKAVTDKSLYKIGENVTITSLVTNIGSEPISIGVEGAFTVYDLQGGKVRDSGYVTTFFVREVQPGETVIAAQAPWPQIDQSGVQVPSGSYDITVWYGSTESGKVRIQIYSGCLIATATYGSELSPEVQFLRNFRDQHVMSTFAGGQFMKAFNAWYYSFSPYIARLIENHPVVKVIVKALLQPLLAILHLVSVTYQAFSFNPELAIILSGFLASSLIGPIYFSLPTTILLIALRRGKRHARSFMHLRSAAAIWFGSVLLMIFGEIYASAPIITVATIILVVLTIGLSASGVALFVVRIASDS